MASAGGARWVEALRSWAYLGPVLPEPLEPFAAPLFSWQRWQQEDLNGDRPPTFLGDGTIVPRPDQVEAADLAERSYVAGRCGFLVGDETGLGKTITAQELVRRLTSATRVLVVCPLSAVAHWRRTIAAMGTHGKRYVIIPSSRLAHLVSVPASAAAAKRRSTKNKRVATLGRSLVQWDLVIIDEAHEMKTPTAQRSALARAVTKGAFVVWMSATAGSTPLELSYLAPLLGQVTGVAVADLDEWEAWCQAQGIALKRGKFGKWEWEKNDDDLDRMHALLYAGAVPAGVRRRPADITGWPELVRIPYPVALGPAERILYREAWTEFRRAMELAARGRDPSNGLAAQTRYRQKASLIRAPGTTQLVADLLTAGHQVAVSVVWLESLEAIAADLEARGVAVARLFGEQGPAEREAQRVAFQRGQAQACVFTVKNTISLHANERSVGGNSTPRVQVDHDLRWSGIDMVQVDGRTHRDGQSANVYWAFAEGTVEAEIAPVLLGRVRDMKRMSGDDTATLKAIEAVLLRAAA